MFRLLPFLKRRSVRFYSSTASSDNSNLPHFTEDDVDYHVNPSEEIIDGFMKTHGNSRACFRKNDMINWSREMGKDDYKLNMTALKGTDTVVASSHMILYRPLDSKEKSSWGTGMGWSDKAYRDRKLTSVASEQIHHVRAPSMNMMGHASPDSRNWWRVINKRDWRNDIGSLSTEVEYMSRYEHKHFKIPDNLSFDGITVKSAHEVPKTLIIDYDQTVHPFHRENYMINHMRDPDGFGKVAFNDEGEVIGLGQAIVYPKRDCNVGPMYGDNTRVVQAMFMEILKEMMAIEKPPETFEVRSAQLCKDSFNWIAPFLNVKPRRHHQCNLVYSHFMPRGVDFSKVYCPTHLQLYMC